MAHIRKRGDYQWQVEIRKKGFPAISKTFETKVDAELWAATVESEMGRGLFQDRSEAEATTLYDALGRYSNEVSIRKDGHAQEKVRIESWKQDDLAKRSLASLRGVDFAKWRDQRLESVTPSTVQKDLAVISHLFTVARKEWGIAVENPIASITIPSEDNARDRRLEGDEEQRLIKELIPIQGRSPWMIPLVQLAIETAARQSELLGLEWTDVDLSKGYIRIRGKDRNNGKRRTKNRDKFRDVPLSSAARSLLSEIPRSISGKVFPLSAAVVRQAFIAAVKRARAKYLDECNTKKIKPQGIMENFTFHDLRHEATSRLAEKLEMHELMKVTGHKDTRMLARYYHPRVEDLARKLG